jgi:hypothetical protein
MSDGGVGNFLVSINGETTFCFGPLGNLIFVSNRSASQCIALSLCRNATANNIPVSMKQVQCALEKSSYSEHVFLHHVWPFLPFRVQSMI